jgi:tripartite-type tricarboxylate transporter receptor subunit TctC
MMRTKRLVGRVILAGAALTLASAAFAQNVDDFYKGKQIRLIIGNAPGGDYDLGGRVVAKYMPRYIPGTPTIVVQNMPGAASIVAANHLFNVAPKDGTVFGSFSRNVPGQAVIGNENLKADPRKYRWIGGSSLPSRVCVAGANSPVKNMKDMSEHELIVAGSGAGSSLSILPTVMNHFLNTKFKIVEGYKGAADAIIALERGEVQGLCHTYSLFSNAHAEMVTQGRARILLHAEEAAFPDDPSVPSVYALTDDEAKKQMMRFIFSSVEFGRPYVAPPGTPDARVAALRTAFAAALKDTELRTEADKLRLDMTYRPPADLEGLVAKLYATPKAQLAEAEKLMPAAGD